MPPAVTARRVQPSAAEQTRRSSGRQIRSTINRPTNYYARPFGSFSGLPVEDSQDDSPPGFFPAIQYFSDAVASLPKEVMRHFTLMKEVEAKIYGPTQEMVRVADRIDKLPLPPRKSYQPSRQTLLSFTANNSNAGGSAAGSIVNGGVTGASGSDAMEQTAQVTTPEEQQMEMQRRQEFYNLRTAITQVLTNLDEKNGCLAEANRTLDRQLSKLDSVMPYVEAEISEEARLGSLTHWAYADNRKKTSGHQGAGSRRDVAATSNLAAAAAAIHEGEIAAARNEGRSHTKKSRLHQQHMDSELDLPYKKTHKGRKGLEAIDSKAGTMHASGSAPASKKRKAEKAVGAPMERSASTAVKATKSSGPTPRSTPAAELVKKKVKPPVPAPSKRRNPTASSPAQSPRMAASPTMATFALANESLNQRPSSRMRQTSSTLQYSMLANRVSPPKEPVKRSNGTNGDEQHGPGGGSANRGGDDVSMADVNDAADPDTKKEPGNDQAQDTDGRAANQDASAAVSDADSIGMSRTRGRDARSRDRSTNMRKSAATRNGERHHSRSGSNNHILRQIASFNRSPVSGRRELPGTEDDSSASESRSASRSKRPGRSANRTDSRVRTPDAEDEEAPPAPALERDNEPDEDVEEGDEQDPDDPDEPKYCYCGRGSYGTMIGCENENCEREWFHLECTGLRAVPSENVKWYCDDCDPRNRRKSKSGRH